MLVDARGTTFDRSQQEPIAFTRFTSRTYLVTQFCLKNLIRRNVPSPHRLYTLSPCNWHTMQLARQPVRIFGEDAVDGIPIEPLQLPPKCEGDTNGRILCGRVWPQDRPMQLHATGAWPSCL